MAGKRSAGLQFLLNEADATMLNVIDESVLAQLLAMGGDVSDFNSATDSLEAISDAIAAMAAAAVGTENAFLTIVGGALADATATGVVSDGKTAMAYIKQIVTLVLAVQADLDNATDGLGALKSLIDIVSSVLGTLEDTSDETVDTATLMALVRKTLSEAHEIEHHLHNWERWFAIAQTNLSATRFAENLSVLAIATDDPWTRLTPGAVNAWGSDVQIWGSEDAGVVPPARHQEFIDLHRMRLHDANDDKKTYIIEIVSSPTSAADGRTAGTCTELPIFIEKAPSLLLQLK